MKNIFVSMTSLKSSIVYPQDSYIHSLQLHIIFSNNITISFDLFIDFSIIFQTHNSWIGSWGNMISETNISQVKSKKFLAYE